MTDGSPEYVLVTGDAGAVRLALLHETYGDTTEAHLAKLGLNAGMHAVDLGCGVGTVTRWMAGRVGPSGRVVGVDVSGAQLAVAKRETERAGLTNVEFHERSGYDTGLPRGSFDLAYCRFLLCHVGEPRRALREMHALLKPGGVVLCEEVDLPSLSCDPPSAGYARMRDLMVALGATRGVDYGIGPRLHRLFRAEGFPAPEVHFEQPVHAAGEAKRFWEYTFLEAVPAMLQAGLTDASELASLANAMRGVALDPATVVAQARKVQVWARRQGDSDPFSRSARTDRGLPGRASRAGGPRS